MAANLTTMTYLLLLVMSVVSERSVDDMRYVQRATRLLNAALHIPAHVLPGLEQLEDDDEHFGISDLHNDEMAQQRSFKRPGMPDPRHSHGIYLPYGRHQLLGVYTPRTKSFIQHKINGAFSESKRSNAPPFMVDDKERFQRRLKARHVEDHEEVDDDHTLELGKAPTEDDDSSWRSEVRSVAFEESRRRRPPRPPQDPRGQLVPGAHKLRRLAPVGQRRGLRDFFRPKRRPRFGPRYTITTLTTKSTTDSGSTTATTSAAYPYPFTSNNSSKASASYSSSSSEPEPEPRTPELALKHELSERLAYEELLEIYKAIRKRHKKDPHLLDDFPLVVKEALARAFLSRPDSYIEDLRRKERLKSSLLKSNTQMKSQNRQHVYREDSRLKASPKSFKSGKVVYDPYGSNDDDQDHVDRVFGYIDGAIDSVNEKSKKEVSADHKDNSEHKSDEKRRPLLRSSIRSHLHILDHMATEDPLKGFESQVHNDNVVSPMLLKPTLNRPPTQRYIRFT